MNVHITNIYGFIQDQDLRKKQNQFADAAHALGFMEMGIFNFDVSTDTENELSKRIDGIISSLQSMIWCLYNYLLEMVNTMIIY